MTQQDRPGHVIRSTAWCLALVVLLQWTTADVSRALAAPQPAGDNAQPAGDVAQPAPPQAPAVLSQPRLEIYVPSMRDLVHKTRQSHVGAFWDYFGALLEEMGSASSETIDLQEATALLGQMKRWPDTPLTMMIFAPDTEGRARWVLGVDWPIRELHARLQSALDTEAANTMFEGLRLQERRAGYKLALPDEVLAYVLPVGEHACVSSHADLIPAQASLQAAPGTPAPLLSCRLRLTGTERDSGATFFSSFSAVTHIDYRCGVADDGQWQERLELYWPPISGMGAKVIFNRVKQTFFVPQEAFGGLVLNSTLLPGMLEGALGFGPQVVVSGAGQMEILDEVPSGPIAAHIKPELCFTLMPGTGFFPVPDVVVQGWTKSPDKMVDTLRAAVRKTNEVFRERDQEAPWHEETVRDRVLFWRDSASPVPGAMMPAVMRPLIFTARDQDARQRERDYVVMAWTSTSPKDFVRRWLDLPRPKDRRFLPTARKTEGQLWLNWRQLYSWIQPYLNIGLSTVGGEAFVPAASEVSDHLVEGLATVKMKYTGLQVAHQGPLPAGIAVLPSLMSMSMSEAGSGDTDLARERRASRQLKVLYHHATLFKKDLGRWPARVAELDGYIDFAGNPQLLKLEKSSRQRWDESLRITFGGDKKDGGKADTPDDVEAEDEGIDDSLYVVEWGRTAWRLGYAANTLEHLKELYVDQDGKIHRVPKAAAESPRTAKDTDHDS